MARRIVPRRLSHDEEAELIKRYGHPMLAAARYKPQQYLIGPTLFPYYVATLKFAAGILLLLHVIVAIATMEQADAVATLVTLAYRVEDFLVDGDRTNADEVREKMTHGVRTWGNDPRGGTVFVVGAYEHLSDVSDRLLRALPPLLALSRAEWGSPLIPLLCDEVVKDEPGQAAVLDSPILPPADKGGRRYAGHHG